MLEKNLVELLLYESSKVVAKLEIDFNKELLNRHPNDYKEKHIAQGLRKQIRKTAIKKNGKRLRRIHQKTMPIV